MDRQSRIVRCLPPNQTQAAPLTDGLKGMADTLDQMREVLGEHWVEEVMRETADELERKERAEIRGLLVQADHALHGALQLIPEWPEADGPEREEAGRVTLGESESLSHVVGGGERHPVMLDGPEARGSRAELRGEPYLSRHQMQRQQPRRSENVYTRKHLEDARNVEGPNRYKRK